MAGTCIPSKLSKPPKPSTGFTLIEMLVVMGIIAVLIGASIAGFSKMTKTAEKAKAQELVANVATALTALYQREGVWPKRLVSNNGKQLNEQAALALAKGGYISMSTTGSDTSLKLAGHDRFGILTPWAAEVVRRRGMSAASSDHVTSSSTVKDHILYYALDLDGDGVISGGEKPDILDKEQGIRATAAVWCIGKSGGKEGKPWPYSTGRKRDDVYSWSYGQTQDIK